MTDKLRIKDCGGCGRKFKTAIEFEELCPQCRKDAEEALHPNGRCEDDDCSGPSD